MGKRLTLRQRLASRLYTAHPAGRLNPKELAWTQGDQIGDDGGNLVNGPEVPRDDEDRAARATLLPELPVIAWHQGQIAFCLALVVARGSMNVGHVGPLVATYLEQNAGPAPGQLATALRLAARELRNSETQSTSAAMRSAAWSRAAQHLASAILIAVGDRV